MEEAMLEEEVVVVVALVVVVAVLVVVVVVVGLVEVVVVVIVVGACFHPGPKAASRLDPWHPRRMQRREPATAEKKIRDNEHLKKNCRNRSRSPAALSSIQMLLRPHNHGPKRSSKPGSGAAKDTVGAPGGPPALLLLLELPPPVGAVYIWSFPEVALSFFLTAIFRTVPASLRRRQNLPASAGSPYT